jgi:MFS family permease
MNCSVKPMNPTTPESLSRRVTAKPSIRGALAALSLSMLLSSLGTSIANVALPTLAQAFSASFQEVQWIVLAYLLAITTLIVSVGRLGDITGRRRLLLAGILLFIAASVVCSVAPTLWLLIGARAAQGLGAAVMMALTMAFVGEIVPKARTGSAMGLLGTMSAIGTALGPSLGGVLIAGFGWRAIFLLNLPLGILTLLLAYRYLPTDRPVRQADRAGFDIVGTLLLALTLAAFALAVTVGGGHFDGHNMALLLAAVLAASAYAAEGSASTPSLLVPPRWGFQGNLGIGSIDGDLAPGTAADRADVSTHTRTKAPRPPGLANCARHPFSIGVGKHEPDQPVLQSGSRTRQGREARAAGRGDLPHAAQTLWSARRRDD